MLIVFPADSWKCPPLSLYSYEKKKRSKKIRKAINCVLAGSESLGDMSTNKLCENIGIFIKNYKSTNPGANKVVYGPCKQESEKKSKF